MKHGQNTINKVISLKEQGLSSRKIAQIVFGRKSCKSTVNDILARQREQSCVETGDGPKILFIDVENQGTVALTHGRFKTNISPKGVISEPYLLTYAANWAHDPEDKIVCRGLDDMPNWHDGDYRNDVFLVEELWELLDDADVVIAHNTAFDEGVINSRFAYHGMVPPSPYKVVCTLKSLKKYFKLPANSLDAATRFFNLERKLDNAGIDLWLRCYKGQETAFGELKAYNRGDIPTLRQLYYRILPFIKNHPNMALYYNDDEIRCNTCGIGEMCLVDDKYAYTNISRFDVYRCNSCGAVKRSRKNIRTKEQMGKTLMNIS